jgi:hypothetical protein
MLSRQTQPVEFTGGLEAARLQSWHVDLLAGLKPKQMFFAYDEPRDYEPLVNAGKMLREAGIIRPSSHAARCYVLCGHPDDTLDSADTRMRQAVELGFFPMAMLYRDAVGKYDMNWRRFQRAWARPAVVASMVKNNTAPKKVVMA